MFPTSVKSYLKTSRSKVQRRLAQPIYVLPYTQSYLKYLTSKWQSKSPYSNSLKQYDLVFVVLDLAKGWILEAICREIATHFPGKYCFI